MGHQSEGLEGLDMSDSHAGGIFSEVLADVTAPAKRASAAQSIEASTLREGLGDRGGTEEGPTVRGRDGEDGDRRSRVEGGGEGGREGEDEAGSAGEGGSR